jgi:hypothetical protein
MPTESPAPKRSGWSSTRQPGATSGPRAITDGFATSRTVTIEPEMISPANGKPASLAVRQPGGSKHATVYSTRGVSRSRSTLAPGAIAPSAPKRQKLWPAGMRHVSPVNGPPMTEASPL